MLLCKINNVVVFLAFNFKPALERWWRYFFCRSYAGV